MSAAGLDVHLQVVAPVHALRRRGRGCGEVAPSPVKEGLGFGKGGGVVLGGGGGQGLQCGDAFGVAAEVEGQGLRVADFGGCDYCFRLVAVGQIQTTNDCSDRKRTLVAQRWICSVPAEWAEATVAGLTWSNGCCREQRSAAIDPSATFDPANRMSENGHSEWS